MTKKKLTPKYNDNKAIRETIDKLLEKNASNVANSGTGGKLDIGDEEAVKDLYILQNTDFEIHMEEAVKEAWSRIQDKIKELDPAFHHIIKER